MLKSLFSHKTLSNTLGFVHEKRRNALLKVVGSLFNGAALTLTSLGRNLKSKAKERNNILCVNRLLRNEHLQSECEGIYKSLAELYLSSNIRPLISVDWSSTDSRKAWHILRASVSLSGRSMTVYQETHPQKQYGSRKIHDAFLKKLKAILPKDSQAILVTDAGFKNPWFLSAEKYGFDWVGRVCGKTGINQKLNDSWVSCAQLYKKATTKIQCLGDCFLSKSHSLPCRIILLKKKPKGRRCYNRRGQRSRTTISERSAKQAKAPWVIATTLSADEYHEKKIINIYAKRMQIEEEFRDTKSTRYGFSLKEARSNDAGRINILLLIAALANFVLWIAGLTAIRKGIHMDFQANTEKKRRVLSVVFLGKRYLKRAGKLLLKDVMPALHELQAIVRTADNV